jgi:hypothetical protein
MGRSTVMNNPFRSKRLAFVTRRQNMSDGTTRVQVMARGDGKLEGDWETIFMSHSEDDAVRFEKNVHNEVSPDMTDAGRPAKPRRILE